MLEATARKRRTLVVCQPRARAFPAILLAGALAVSGCLAHQYRLNPRVAVVEGDPIVQMKPQGELPSVDHATLVPVEKHSNEPDEIDRVVGLLFDSEARAYPIGLLDRFEVINDAAAGVSYVVVRCALTGIVAVYDRQVGSLLLTFENSGALWRDTLVLRDRETGTYWSAANGRGIEGPLGGQRLRGIPAATTTSGSWRKAHPQSLYLDLEASTIVPLVMRLYEASASQGVSGQRTGDKRYKPKEEVFVVAEGTDALAFEAKEIRAVGNFATTLGGMRVGIAWDSALGTPRASSISASASELPVIPMYWFAVGRHFASVHTFREAAAKNRSLQE